MTYIRSGEQLSRRSGNRLIYACMPIGTPTRLMTSWFSCRDNSIILLLRCAVCTIRRQLLAIGKLYDQQCFSFLFIFYSETRLSEQRFSGGRHDIGMGWTLRFALTATSAPAAPVIFVVFFVFRAETITKWRFQPFQEHNPSATIMMDPDVLFCFSDVSIYSGILSIYYIQQ